MKLDDAKATFSNRLSMSGPPRSGSGTTGSLPTAWCGSFDRMLEAGMGGAVMHARSGLDHKEYLDERWFAGIKAVVERAAECGATAWLYDELGWPSGTAGGRVPREHPEFRMYHLRLHDITPADEAELANLAEGLVGAYHVTRTDALHGFQRRARQERSTFAGPDRVRADSVAP